MTVVGYIIQPESIFFTITDVTPRLQLAPLMEDAFRHILSLFTHGK